jgi:hypothetical protein
MPRMTGTSARPFSVSAYATRTGVPVWTVRVTIPSDSSSRIRAASTRALTFGMAFWTSRKWRGAAASAWMTSPVHLRPSRLNAPSTEGQDAVDSAGGFMIRVYGFPCRMQYY